MNNQFTNNNASTYGNGQYMVQYGTTQNTQYSTYQNVQPIVQDNTVNKKAKDIKLMFKGIVKCIPMKYRLSVLIILVIGIIGLIGMAVEANDSHNTVYTGSSYSNSYSNSSNTSSGNTSSYTSSSSSSSSSSSRTCGYCSGKGSVKCGTCDGKGYYTITTHTPQYTSGVGGTQSVTKTCSNPSCVGGYKDCPFCP